MAWYDIQKILLRLKYYYCCWICACDLLLDLRTLKLQLKFAGIKDTQNLILQYRTLLWKCGRAKFKWIKEITVTWKHLFEALIWIHLESFWWQSILNTECSSYICISYDLINRNASAKTTTAGKLHVLRIRISPYVVCRFSWQ